MGSLKPFVGTVSLGPIDLRDVAVVVATRNDGRTLRPCIDSLLRAARKRAEIWVVNDASTDDTAEILRSYGDQIRLLAGEGKGPGKARNLALKGIARPWVAFTDGDCRATDDWLTALCGGLTGQSEEVAGIGGAQLIPSDATGTERRIGEFLETVSFVSDYLHSGEGVRRVRHNPSCNVLYSREALESVGGFDESLWPCEDLELDLRLGKAGRTLLFLADAKVEHRRPNTLLLFAKMMRRYGFAHVQLVKTSGFSQGLHILPVLVPVGAAAVVWGLFVNPVPTLSVLVVLGLLTLVLIWKRARSIWLALVYGALLKGAILSWLWGFYGGLFGSRRIAGTKGG